MVAPKRTNATVLLCSLLLIFAFFSGFLPAHGLWGINHLSYFSLPFAQVVTTIGLIFCMLVAALSDRGRRYSPKGDIGGSRFTGWPLILGITAISAPFFWFIKPATYLLGDQQLQLNELTFDILALRNAPLTVLINTGLHRLLRAGWGLDVRTSYGVSTCLSGVVFVFLLLRLLRLLKFSSVNAISSGLVVFAAAPTLFFFGYAENYTYLYVATMAYLYFSLRAIERKKQLLPSLAFLVLAISFHYIGLLLLPSFALLCANVISKGRRPRPRELSFYVSGVLLTLLIIYVFLRMHTGAEMFVPLWENEKFPGYTLFSLTHLKDVLNELLLISPAGILVLVLHFRTRFKSGHRVDGKLTFMFLASLFPLVFLLTAEPDLGFARDWDIFAIAGLTVSVLAIAMVSSYRPVPTRSSPAMLCIALTGIFLFFPWVLINTDEWHSIDRYSVILAHDPHSRAYGYETLALHYKKKKEWPLMVEALKLASESSPENPRYYGMLGDAYDRMGFPGSSFTYYMAAIEVDSSYGPAYIDVGNLYYRKFDMDSARKFYIKAAERMPYTSAAWFNIGTTYLNKMELKLAAEILEHALSVNPGDATGNFNLSQVYHQRGDYILADYYLEKAVRFGFAADPDYVRLIKQGLNKQTDNGN